MAPRRACKRQDTLRQGKGERKYQRELTELRDHFRDSSDKGRHEAP
jgi:hypothetical protein